MAKDGVRDSEQIKAYPRGNAQGGRALQAVRGSMDVPGGTEGSRTVIRETPEGRAIARTRDHMPMVEVEKLGGEIGVDHGIIDMLSAAPLNPDSYKDGVLWRTPFVDSYIVAAEATPTDPNKPVVDEIEPPDSVKGTAPADGTTAKSCRAAKDRSNVMTMYAKKIMMGQCPPSLFTGRTRLWVQAMYGRHDDLSLCALYTQALSVPPGLTLSGVTSDDFFLNTNVGVYYEASTGKHWCIKVFTDHADIYPMEAREDIVEDLREWLVDPTITVEERERIETYILADSIPVIGKKQTVTFAYVVDWSMGYGWHFNWGGDRCDIVTNGTVPYGGGGEHNVSNHYRLQFAKNVGGVWSVLRTLEEGPAYWKARRNVDPIAAPLWEDGTLEKFGAHLGPEPYGNAPIYAFYARNELKVLRYSANTTTNAKSAPVREPSYLNPNLRHTFGSDSMEYRARSDWAGSNTAFSCGDVTIAYTQGSYSENVYTRSSPNVGDVSSKVSSGPSASYMSGSYDWAVGQPTGMIMGTITDEYNGTITVYGGTGGPGSSYDTSSFGPFDGTTREDFGTLYVRATQETFTAASTVSTQFLVVIPFYDAEAVYLYGQRHTETLENGTTDVVSGGWFYFRGEWETHSIMATYGMASDGGPAESSVPINRTTTNQVSTGKLVCRAGTFDASFPGSSGFWSVNDTVGQQYPTYASASGESVKAAQNDVDSGNSNGTDASLYVGWA